jgi:transcriptional regulator with XRE-family HTH domain
MKHIISKAGFRIRAFRKSRKKTQHSLAAECRQAGFPVTREKLANYELGRTDVPAWLIPIVAQVLEVDIVDLLPPIGKRVEPKFTQELAKGKNLAGQKIRFFRKKRQWTQCELAAAFEKTGVRITRQIIANVETQRCALTDLELVWFAKALQVPFRSLFPDEAEATGFPDVFKATSQTQNSLAVRWRNKPATLSPFIRMAQKIGKFANRLIPHR